MNTMRRLFAITALIAVLNIGFFIDGSLAETSPSYSSEGA
jgi:hypothetical protein